MYRVIASSVYGIVLWNGEDVDEWNFPSHTEIEGDYAEFKPDTYVDIIIRKIDDNDPRLLLFRSRNNRTVNSEG